MAWWFMIDVHNKWHNVHRPKRKDVKQLERKKKCVCFSVRGAVCVCVCVCVCVGRVVLTAVNDGVTQTSGLMSEIM